MKSIIDKIIDQIEEYKVDIMDLAIKEQLPNFSVEKIKEIIIDYKNKKKQIKKQNQIAITNGNPYTTVILLMEAISSESKITIYNQNNLNKLNQKILDIIAGEIDIKIEPELVNKLEINDLEERAKTRKNTKILVIDDNEKCELLRVMGLSVENMQILSINMYVDTDQLNSIKNAMIEYCNKNYIKMTLFESNSSEEKEESKKANELEESMIKLIEKNIENNTSKATIILTKNEESYKKLQEKFKTEEIYINMNPFDTIEQKIAKQIIMNVNKI